MKKKNNSRPVQPTSPVENIKAKNNLPLILSIIVSACAFLLYANTLSHDYTVDDATVMANNKLTTQGVRAIPEIFTSAYRKGFWERKESLYRPLSVAMFAAEWQIAPNNPHLGHWINVCFFTLTAFVLFIFLKKLFAENKTYFAFFITLLFVTHPIHTEVVSNIKSRDEIMSFLFSILSLLFLVKNAEKKNIVHSLLSAFFFLLALLSKESAISLFLVAPLLVFVFRKAEIKESLITSAPVFASAFIYLLIRFAVLGGVTNFTEILPINNSLVTAGSFIAQKATALYILGKYFLLLIFPHPLCFDYSFNQIPNRDFGDLGVLFSLVFFLAIFIYALKNLKSGSILAFAILFFLITISLTSNIFFLIESVMAERFLYLPSLGFCIGIMAFLSRYLKFTVSKKPVSSVTDLLKSNTSLSIFILVVCLLFSFKTISRNTYWANNLTLLAKDVNTSPESARIRYAFGSAILIEQALKEKDEARKMALLDKSIVQLEKGVSILNTYSDAYYHLALAYKEKKDYPNAVKNFELAMKSKTFTDADFFIAAGVAYGLNKNYDKSIATLMKALSLKPGHAETYNNLGVYYDEWGKRDSSLWALGQAVKLDSLSQSAYYNLGNTYAHLGNFDLAITYYKKSLSLDANNIDAINNIGNCYASKKDFSGALTYFLKALEKDSTNAKAINNVGITYMMLGDKAKGEYYLGKLSKR